MEPNSSPPGRTLLVVLAMGVASFSVSTAVAEATAASIHSRALDITGNALPSLDHLAHIRTTLLHTQMLASEFIEGDAVRRAQSLQELVAEQAALGSELASYRALPLFPGEGVLAQRLSSEIQRVSHGVGALETLGLESARARDGIDWDSIEPSVEDASRTTQELIDLNTRAADDRVLQIEAIRRRSARAAVALDVLSALLCCVAGLLSWRTVQAYVRAQVEQRKLQEAKAIELEAFSGRVAHDILNPLGAIALALSLIERYGSSEAMVARARSPLRRATQIVDALLSFARAGANPTPGAHCSVRVAIADAISCAEAAAQNARVILATEAIPHTEVACHEGVLASLLSNLLLNAIKYMGSSTVRRVSIRVRDLSSRVLFEIEDTGPGIDPEIQAHIFDPFVRANPGSEPGIGLGLATVRRLCVAHGGRLGLRSHPGSGSSFWFELPTYVAMEAPDPVVRVT
jgi:signal transduction histidine kinase